MTRAIDKVKPCSTMLEVRREVNALDDVLVPLLVERVGYMTQAARIKQHDSQVRDEERRVAGYRARLESLENESAQVVGNLILRQFRDIQVQFYQIVMRADLGLVDVAWEQREEHNNRARMLAEEQNREINALNDEYREVTEGARPDDARQLQGATPAAGAAPAATPAPQTPSAGSPPSNAAATPATTPSGGSQTAAPAAPQGQTP